MDQFVPAAAGLLRQVIQPLHRLVRNADGKRFAPVRTFQFLCRDDRFLFIVRSPFLLNVRGSLLSINF